MEKICIKNIGGLPVLQKKFRGNMYERVSVAILGALLQHRRRQGPFNKIIPTHIKWQLRDIAYTFTTYSQYRVTHCITETTIPNNNIIK